MTFSRIPELNVGARDIAMVAILLRPDASQTGANFSELLNLLEACPYRELKTAGGNCDRVMLLPDVQSLQTDLVCTSRAVSVPRLAGSREPGASAPTQYPAAQFTEADGPR